MPTCPDASTDYYAPEYELQQLDETTLARFRFEINNEPCHR